LFHWYAGLHFGAQEMQEALDGLIINASEHCVKGKCQNLLPQDRIDKIIKTCQFREEAVHYSRRIDMAEIEKMISIGLTQSK
jgi:hypothetical protein